MHAYRTNTCGELRKADVDKKVRLSGWIHSVRDHGGIVECVSRERGVTFRVLLPMLRGTETPRDFEGDPSA